MVFNVWTIYPQFSSEGEKHLNIVPKLYLVMPKLILSDINIHKHRNIRNSPGDRKQSFPGQLFKIKKAIITFQHDCFYRISFIGFRFIDKKKHRAKASKRLFSETNTHQLGFHHVECTLIFFSSFNTVALGNLLPFSPFPSIEGSLLVLKLLQLF